MCIRDSFISKDIGYEILASGGIKGNLATFSIYAGSFLDVIIGIWLLSGINLKNCYLIQMFVIALYTVLLSVIEPAFWVHPFGPLTKNIPLLVMIYYLYRINKSQDSDTVC